MGVGGSRLLRGLGLVVLKPFVGAFLNAFSHFCYELVGACCRNRSVALRLCIVTILVIQAPSFL